MHTQIYKPHQVLIFFIIIQLMKTIFSVPYYVYKWIKIISYDIDDQTN